MTRSTATRRRKDRTQNGSAEITTYPTAVRFLSDRTDFERTRVARLDSADFKLERMNKLLDAWDRPQDQVRLVHVAGSVGKGSTVAMIAAMLQGCGYTVGQYTSPHLIDLRERIAINGQLIPKADFTNLLRDLQKLVGELKIEPTYFELLTACSLRYFADQAVDLAVIEVGLGGRLDATNVIMPDVSVITQIAADHQQILGDTLDEIAREKAGIMKKGIPCITYEQDKETMAALESVAEEVGSPLRIVGRDIEFSRRFNSSEASGDPQSRICVLSETSQFMHMPVPVAGPHQAANCALALAVIDALKGSGFDCGEVEMIEGLSTLNLPGRMELVWDAPRIIIDGAHNPASLDALMRSIGSHLSYDSMVCIFGCCEDKDVPAMLQQAARGGDKFIFTKARGNPRAMDPEDLHRQFGEVSGKMSQVAPSISDALDLARRAVGRDDLICVTGSFYLVGEVKKYLADLDRKQNA